jgi:hypothetical protein
MSARGWLIAIIFLAAACDRAPVLKIDHVSVHPSALGGLVFNYQTSTPSADCKAQIAEFPKVWDLVVKPHLTDSHLERVILFPEDPSGQSVSFEFTKSGPGWESPGPCPASIPAS